MTDSQRQNRTTGSQDGSSLHAGAAVPGPGSEDHSLRRERVSSTSIHVAIVDATDATALRLETALQAEGFQTERLDLGAFRSGQEALEALAADGVGVVVYELGEKYHDHRALFSQLLDDIAVHGTPLFITTFDHWAEEQTAGGGSQVAWRALQGLVNAIRRQLGQYHATS